MGSFLRTTNSDTMIKLCLLSLSVLLVSGAPYMEYLDYLPASVKDFVEDTIDKGTDVFEELQEDVEKEIIGKTSGNFENMSERMEEMLKKFYELKEKNDDIWEDYDFTEAEEKELSEKLNEIEVDISEDEKISDDVEKMIQQYLHTFRASLLSMTKSWRGWHKSFFNSSELIVPATEILSKGAKDMKADISDLFKTFREIDIKKIGGDEEDSEGVPRVLDFLDIDLLRTPIHINIPA